MRRGGGWETTEMYGGRQMSRQHHSTNTTTTTFLNNIKLQQRQQLKFHDNICKFNSDTLFLNFIKNHLNFAQAQCSYFFQQFEAQNVLILFLTAIYSFMVENQLQRPSF